MGGVGKCKFSARLICLSFLSLRLLLRKIHLPRQREAKKTETSAVFDGRTQFAPNVVKFTLRFCLRDAEDVVPYELVETIVFYYQQYFDF